MRNCACISSSRFPHLSRRMKIRNGIIRGTWTKERRKEDTFAVSRNQQKPQKESTMSSLPYSVMGNMSLKHVLKSILKYTVCSTLTSYDSTLRKGNYAQEVGSLCPFARTENESPSSASNVRVSAYTRERCYF